MDFYLCHPDDVTRISPSDIAGDSRYSVSMDIDQFVSFLFNQSEGDLDSPCGWWIKNDPDVNRYIRLMLQSDIRTAKTALADPYMWADHYIGCAIKGEDLPKMNGELRKDLISKDFCDSVHASALARQSALALNIPDWHLFNSDQEYREAWAKAMVQESRKMRVDLDAKPKTHPVLS